MQENLTQAQNATGAGPGRADSAPAQHTAQGETAPHAAQTFDRAQVQREIDRVAKRERERGKRQALREMQKAQESQDSTERVHREIVHTEEEGGKNAQDNCANEGEMQSNAQNDCVQELQTQENAQENCAEKEVNGEGAQQNSAQPDDPVGRLSREDQQALGAAQAQRTIAKGEEAVLAEMEALSQKQTLSPKEEETLFTLFCHASMKAGEEELNRRGLDGAKIINDKAFIRFAELMRGDVPLMTVYEYFAKTQGRPVKPPSTGPLPGQSTGGPAYFSREQVQNMTRAQVKTHYKEIESSRRFWR